MKTRAILVILLLMRLLNINAQSEVNITLCMASLCAQELSYYNAFSKSEDNTFRCLTEQLKNKEVFFYDKGEIFRTCRTKNNQLNGAYEIFYRNGSVFIKSIYENGYPKDSTVIFYENGTPEKKIYYDSYQSFRVVHFTEQGQVKKRVFVNHTIDCTDYLNFYNSEKYASEIKYYDGGGQEITREKYLIQNPENQ